MEPISMRILSGEDVRNAVSMRDAIDVVRSAFEQLSSGVAIAPTRTAVPVAEHEGISLFMPAYLPEEDALGTKVVSVFPGNQVRGLKTIHAVMLVLESATGRPRAIMDATWLTALRTGAASGLATDLLARPDAMDVAIIGAGGQARAQMQGVMAVRCVSTVRVYDTSREVAEGFASEMSDSAGVPIEVATSAGEAVRDADIVCTATTSHAPVFDDRDIRPGTHINAIGAYTPEMQEVPVETVARARVFVDSREAAMEEAGDLLLAVAADQVGPEVFDREIGALAAGRLPGRATADEITMFKAVGVAVQDVAVGRLVLSRAEKLDLGIRFQL